MPNPLSPGQGGDPLLIVTGAHKITVGTQVVGFTTGNVQLSYNVNKRQVYVNEFGQTPVNEEVLGLTLGIKFTLPEKSLKVMDIAYNGLYPAGQFSATLNRGLGRNGVVDAQSSGKSVTLHPIAVTGTAEDIVLNKVLLTPTGNTELSEQNQRMIEVEGTCVVDLTKTNGAYLATLNTANVGQ